MTAYRFFSIKKCSS